LEDDGSDLLVVLNPAAHEVAGGSAIITPPSLNFKPILFPKNLAVNVTLADYVVPFPNRQRLPASFLR
jgi:hypothetical protein